MTQALIEIPLKSEGEDTDVMFKFKKMSVEEAAEWGSKMKSRATYREAVDREIEKMDKLPILERNMDDYFDLSDRSAKMLVEISKLTRNLAQFVVEPPKETVEKMINDRLEDMLELFLKYLENLFPSEQDSKNC